MTLADEFFSKKNIYERCANKVNSLLGELLVGAGIKVHYSGFRVKSVDSLRGKLERKFNKYNSLDDVTDLVGLRVITYYDDDVNAVASLIEKEFVIDEVNSIDKRKAHEPDRFGYMSLHYIASLGGDRCKLPEYRDFLGLKFEIQTRTLLQHAWAEIEHDLGYKSDREIPFEVRRKFSRVASFLEEADDSFVQLRNSLNEYRRRIESVSPDKIFELSIDKDSMQLFLESKLVDIDQKMASELSQDFNKDYAIDRLVEVVVEMGYSSFQEIYDDINSSLDGIVILLKGMVAWGINKNYPQMPYVLGTSIFALYLMNLYKNSGHGGIEKYYDSTYWEQSDVDEFKRIIEDACKNRKRSQNI